MSVPDSDNSDSGSAHTEIVKKDLQYCNGKVGSLSMSLLLLLITTTAIIATASATSVPTAGTLFRAH